MLALYDTGRGRTAELVSPGRGANAPFSMYVCGPTVYDVPHIGHGRFALVFDVLRRYLEFSGQPVRHVSNVTDIDDNIIRRAAERGVAAAELAITYEQSWWAAVDALGVARPHVAPRATEYVEPMVALVSRLMSAGAAYETGDGVYLSTDKVPGYGLLARQSLDSLRCGARVVADAAKRSPLDFALWKLAKPGEPSWPSPWGAGRPGWHTECVVMSLDLLGEGFDLHGGGADLAFPHHENERAQAVADGCQFARHWAHNGFVEVGGEKMSKSLNNFTSLTDLLASTDGRAYRVVVLGAHYRAPVEVTRRTLEAATATLAGFDQVLRRLGQAGIAADDPGGAGFAVAGSPAEAAAGRVTVPLMDRFLAAMDDDLDTPAALAVMAEARRQANSALDAGDGAGAAAAGRALVEMARAVGLPLGTVEEAPPSEVEALAVRRQAARSGRDFAAADALRQELAAAGWTVEDTASGPRLHRHR
ncbi:MAG: cysteine--tRNA ligase [Acidimicrobiales bacterium]